MKTSATRPTETSRRKNPRNTGTTPAKSSKSPSTYGARNCTSRQPAWVVPTVVTVLAVIGLVTWAAAGTGPSSKGANSTVRGESRILRLQEYAPDKGLPESMAEFDQAWEAVQDTAGDWATKVSEALERLQQEKTAGAEAQLYATVAQAIARQDTVLDRLGKAAEEVAVHLDALDERLGKAEAEWDDQRNAAVLRCREGAERCEEIRVQLTAMAANLPDLIDDGEQLDPEVERAVVVLDAILQGQEDCTKGAEAEVGIIELDCQQLAGARIALARQTTALKATAEVIRAKQTLLRFAARRQLDSMRRRILMWQVDYGIKTVSKRDFDELSRTKLAVPTPWPDPSASNREFPLSTAMRAVDVLRRYVPGDEPVQDKPADSAETESVVGIIPETGDEDVQERE